MSFLTKRDNNKSVHQIVTVYVYSKNRKKNNNKKQEKKLKNETKKNSKKAITKRWNLDFIATIKDFSNET